MQKHLLMVERQETDRAIKKKRKKKKEREDKRKKKYWALCFFCFKKTGGRRGKTKNVIVKP